MTSKTRDASKAGARSAHPRRRRTWMDPAILFALAVAVAALAPSIFGGKIPAQTDWTTTYSPWAATGGLGTPHSRTGGDSFLVYLPDRLAALREWKAGRLPLWNPHVYGGMPFLGMQTANPLDPLLPLMLILPLGPALGLTYAALLFAAGVGMILLLRERGIRSRPALALGAAAFALNPYFTCWLELRVFVGGLATLPLALWALERVIKRGSAGGGAVLSLSLGYALLAGNLQTAALFLTLLLLRAAWLAREARATTEGPPVPGTFRRAGIAGLAGLALGSLPLIAGLELFLHSTRLGGGIYYTESNFLPWRSMALWFSPEVFGGHAGARFTVQETFHRTMASGSGWGALGIVPLGLALLALVRRTGPRSERLFWGGLPALVLAFLFALGGPLHGFLSGRWPGFDAVDVLRGLVVVNLGGAVLAARGAEELGSLWETRESRGLWCRRLGAFFLLGVAAVVLASWGVHSHRLLSMDLLPLCSVCLAILILGLVRPRPGAGGAWKIWVLAAMVALELGYLHYRTNTFSARHTDYPPHPLITSLRERLGPPDHYRFLVPKNFRLFPPNVPSVYGLSDIRGYSSVPLARYRTLLECAEGRGDLRNQPALHRAESPIYRMLGAAYVFSREDLSPGLFAPVELYGILGSSFFRRDVLSRAFLAPRVAPVSGEAEMRHLLSQPAFDPSRVVYVEADRSPALPADRAETGTRVEIQALESTRVAARVQTPAAAVLVLADPYYPGWKAEVDGREAEIFPANWALRGVVVPAGEHRVEFRYAPWWLWPGAALTVLGLLAALVGIYRAAPPNLFQKSDSASRARSASSKRTGSHRKRKAASSKSLERAPTSG